MSYYIRPNTNALEAWIDISEKDSSGSFTVTADVHNTSSDSRLNCHISCSLTDSAPWSRIDFGTIAGDGWAHGSVNIASGNTSSQLVYVYKLVGSTGVGDGASYQVSGYVDPTPEFVKKTLNITSSLSNNPITQIMGQTLSIWDSGGTGVTRVDHI